MSGVWDLTALINAADAKAPRVQRHLWLVRLMEWLRHAPAARPGDLPRAGTPLPALRLKHLLQVLDAQPALHAQVAGTLQAFWRDIDCAALLADFGFGSRLSLRSELAARLRQQIIPGTPDTQDLAALFPLLFEDDDARWIDGLEPTLLERLIALAAPAGIDWRANALHAITMLASALRAAGFAPLLRQRMDSGLLRDEPFRQLAISVDEFREHVAGQRHSEALVAANMLRSLLDRCVVAADSVGAHLEVHGVSVDVSYEVDQLRGRAQRIEHLVALVLAPQVGAEVHRLLLELLRVQRERRGVRALLASHYSLLARQVAERSAETGEHYIASSPRRVPRDAAARTRRRRGHRRHDVRQIRARGDRAVGVLGRLLRRRELRGDLRHRDAAALDGGHQTTRDDGAGNGSEPAAPGRGRQR